MPQNRPLQTREGIKVQSTDLTHRITLAQLKSAYVDLSGQLYGHIPAEQRLRRAMEMLCYDRQYTFLQESDGTYTVTGPNAAYTVTATDCNCPDSEVLCKHRLAIRLFQMAQRRYV